MRKSGVSTEFAEASRLKCVSSAPVLMPSMKSRPLSEEVTETVVPGQTRISPPRDRLSTAVSAPAVTDDPPARRVPASTTAPEPPELSGTTAGRTPVEKVATEGGCDDFSTSPCKCTRSRFPVASQVYGRGQINDQARGIIQLLNLGNHRPG